MSRLSERFFVTLGLTGCLILRSYVVRALCGTAFLSLPPTTIWELFFSTLGGLALGSTIIF